MRAYSMGLRERVLASRDDGMTTAEVAEVHRVSAAWALRLKQRRRKTGEVASRVARPELAGKADRLRKVVRANPDRTGGRVPPTAGHVGCGGDCLTGPSPWG